MSRNSGSLGVANRAAIHQYEPGISPPGVCANTMGASLGGTSIAFFFLNNSIK
jgi:hypothetical protein